MSEQHEHNFAILVLGDGTRYDLRTHEGRRGMVQAQQELARNVTARLQALEVQLTEAISQRQAALDAMASAVEEAERLREHVAGLRTAARLAWGYWKFRYDGCESHAESYLDSLEEAETDMASALEQQGELRRDLAAANQDTEALAKAVVRSGRLNHLLQFPHVSRAAFEQEQLDALASHAARLASQPPAEAEGA